MCGICGFNGALEKRPNIDALKILGILNEERGKDSAGMVLNNKIYKKGNKTTFRELVQELKINKQNVKGNVFIHTRAATVGALTADNAHPYLFEEEGKPSMIFMHNGTIRNIDALATKYNVDTKDCLTDSRKLGKIIYEGNLDVLKEYTGAASIAFYYLDKPEEVYLWNGASQKGKDYYMERGLYYVVLPNGTMYFSSQDDHLLNALNQPDGVKEVPVNHLCKFVQGKLVEKTPYDRSHLFYISNGGYLGYTDDKGPYAYAPPVTTVMGDNYTHLWPWAVAKTSIRYLAETSFFITEFSRDDFMNKNIATGVVYFNGNRYMYVEGGIQTLAHGILNLTWSGSTKGLGIKDNKYFIDGYMIQDRDTYLSCLALIKDKLPYERTNVLLKHCHKDTIYMSSNNGTFDSQFMHNTVINFPSRSSLYNNVTGCFTVPYSPYIFYVHKNIIRGFYINKAYIDFFKSNEIIKYLNISSKVLKHSVKYVSDFDSFSKFMMDKHNSVKSATQSLINFPARMQQSTVVFDSYEDVEDELDPVGTGWSKFLDQNGDRLPQSKTVTDFDCDGAQHALDEIDEASRKFDGSVEDAEIVEDVSMTEVADEFSKVLDEAEIGIVEVREYLELYLKLKGKDAFSQKMDKLIDDFEWAVENIKDEIVALV